MIDSPHIRRRYLHVISLGGSCKVAGLLKRCGLREASYPFDWNLGSPESVMSLIDGGFDGFLELESLAKEDGVVRDLRFGIGMPNDFDAGRPLEGQHEVVSCRYQRRIQRFARATAEPTLFVRLVRDEAELRYLEEHLEDFLLVLRRLHPAHDLALVIGSGSSLRSSTLTLHVLEDAGFRRMLLRLDYPRWQRFRNLRRDLPPVLMRALRARVAIRTRARRLLALHGHSSIADGPQTYS